ncbi:MAG TPA: NAD-glutamate dehydrogenase, partial [Acidimicrobiia bacterium]|nr:NAD-glutamate dehydrogenase [Acidimicrobiia bacterium]
MVDDQGVPAIVPSGDRRDLIDRVAARVADLVQPTDPPGADEFARALYEQIDEDELRVRAVDDLAAAAFELWRLAEQRAPGTARVRVYAPPRGHSVVAVVVDDMPFIVDSITMALDRHDFGVHLVAHPIVRVRRSATGELRGLAPDAAPAADDDGALLESWTHIEVDRETSAEILDDVRADLERVLRDVRVATTDWLEMLAALQQVTRDLEHSPPPVAADELHEGIALLHWLADQHFTFLGYRNYDLHPDGALCPVAGSGLGLLRHAPERPSASFASLPAEVRAKARERTLLVLTKANARSTVHRPTYLDYVGVKRYDGRGNVVGEHRFLGLYTSSAYTRSPRDVPVLRRKVTRVIERAGFIPASHDQKDLAQILETYPRDDLFQIDDDHLYDTAMAILRLGGRRRVRLFVHREPYGRFVSCLVFLPRDRYTTQVRTRIG